jgi:hypothetical protein
MRSDPQALGVLLTGGALHTAQQNVVIAAMRRPTLGSSMKEAGLNERHFPRDLQAAFNIAMTNSQAEIRRLVAVRDPRIWPLYGKRIIEWNEVQARAAARQLVHSIGRREEHDVISAVYPDDSSEFAAKSKLAAPICETPEKRARFEKTLVAIRDIIGDLEEISSKRIVDELAQVEDGPWAEWGKGRHKKPLTQNALARLLKLYKVFPVNVGPEHARRKGYKRAQFEHLFEAYLNPLPSVPHAQPRSRAEGDRGDHA